MFSDVKLLRYFQLTVYRHGLPTRSRIVSEYMIGLEKTKAKAGDVSHSARALTLDHMHRLYNYLHRPDQSDADRRWGIIRWVRKAQLCQILGSNKYLTGCLPSRFLDDAAERRSTSAAL